ncbi:UNVERIFIED_CONTAM: hypothetical protein NCL1_10586 [Trichonephila clavipes]
MYTYVCKLSPCMDVVVSEITVGERVENAGAASVGLLQVWSVRIAVCERQTTLLLHLILVHSHCMGIDGNWVTNIESLRSTSIMFLIDDVINFIELISIKWGEIKNICKDLEVLFSEYFV